MVCPRSIFIFTFTFTFTFISMMWIKRNIQKVRACYKILFLNNITWKYDKHQQRFNFVTPKRYESQACSPSSGAKALPCAISACYSAVAGQRLDIMLHMTCLVRRSAVENRLPVVHHLQLLFTFQRPHLSRGFVRVYIFCRFNISYHIFDGTGFHSVIYHC